MKLVSTAAAPRPLTAYSQGVEAGGFVFTAGQVGIDPATGKLAQGLERQADLAFANVAAVLRAAALDVSAVVKMTIYVTDLTQFGAVNAAYERFVGSHRPARSTVAVAALPLSALIEVEAIAAQP